MEAVLALHRGRVPGLGADHIVVTQGHALGLRARASPGAKPAPSQGLSPDPVPSLETPGTNLSPVHLANPRRSQNPSPDRGPDLDLDQSQGTRAGHEVTARTEETHEAGQSLRIKMVTALQTVTERMMIGIEC